MLRKRTRSIQKDQQNMGQTHNLILDSNSNSNDSFNTNCDSFLKQKHKTNSFFTVPGLFVGLNPKNSDSDSAKSPTSPLDFKVFSKPNFGILPILCNSKPNNSVQNSWHCNKVGLSIIESLDNESKPSILRSSDSKTVLFNNPRLKTATFDRSDPFDPFGVLSNSLPKLISPLSQEQPCAKFWSNSLDSANLGLNSSTRLATRPANPNPETTHLVASLSASEIELSEDYTCVRKHGPNPKTTHIFGDCILERHENEFIPKVSKREEDEINLSEVVNSDSYLGSDFLSFCYSCKKKLEGEDIYMYRGEKAFCSWNCRSEEILIEEEMEKINSLAHSDSETSMFIAP